jgi:hypothetical protein
MDWMAKDMAWALADSTWLVAGANKPNIMKTPTRKSTRQGALARCEFFMGMILSQAN